MIGRFFKWNHLDSDERELLVFLTPRIVDSRPAFAKQSGGNMLMREQNNFPNKQAVRMALDKLSVR